VKMQCFPSDSLVDRRLQGLDERYLEWQGPGGSNTLRPGPAFFAARTPDRTSQDGRGRHRRRARPRRYAAQETHATHPLGGPPAAAPRGGCPVLPALWRTHARATRKLRREPRDHRPDGHRAARSLARPHVPARPRRAPTPGRGTLRPPAAARSDPRPRHAPTPGREGARRGTPCRGIHARPGLGG
jgi:hypothetical protein